MSKKTNTAVATKPAAPAPGGAPVRRDSAHALWAALRAHPDSTTAALADIAGIGNTTARGLLARWETAGHALAHTDPDAPRAAKTWTTGTGAPADIEPAPAATTNPEPAEPAGPAPEPAIVAGETVPPLHSAEARALWEALTANPGSTTSALARIASIGTPPARHLLTEWTLAGFAWQLTNPAKPRAGAEWTAGTKPAPAAPESAPAAPVPATTEEPAPAAPVPDAAPETAVAAPTGDETATPAPEPPAVADDVAANDAESTVERLPAGALRGQVEDFLHDNPGKEFTPHQIGKVLDRSSGAVHNALVKLTDGGVARQTNAAPKRFTLAS